MNNKGFLTGLAFIIVIIGGINQGIAGLIDADLILSIFGKMLGRLFFVVIGVSAAYLIYIKLAKKPIV
jgi:uncharacterized membrane protein YuzA (DUF378 family)